MISTESSTLFKSARTKVISIGFILGSAFIVLSVYLAHQHMEETKNQRLDQLKQTVNIARNAIEPILVEYRSQDISMEDTLEQVRDLVRRMVYHDHEGKNYIFMSAYDGIMLVQPFEPQKEMTDMWDLKDARGTYIIRELVKTAKSEKGRGYVSYYYQRPGQPAPEEKISFVMGIPELGCYIGTGQYMSDLRRSQLIYIGKTAGSVLILLILIFFQIRASVKEIHRQNRMLHRENESLKLTEKALQGSEAKYRELVEQSPIGLALTRMDGRFVSVNSAYAKIMGYSIDEILDSTFWDLTPSKCVQKDREQMERIELTGKYGPYEKEYFHKDGHLVPVRINGMIVVREDERFIWSSVEDITALKNAEKEKEKLAERLQQSYKMEAIGTLAGGIAHDFNNILSPILGYTEMLLGEIGKENTPLKYRLNKIYTSSLRAKDLVNQILTFSRQEKTEFKLLKVQTVIKEALKLIRSTLPATVDIEKDIEDDCSPVKADPTQIHQIIMNLSTNAYHAMENEGGVMKISLREIEIKEKGFENSELEPGCYALLSIADQGIGMDPDTIKKIFNPFFTTKGLGKGTGMGLSVVHGIVKNMKGEILVKSEPGKGTEFNIFFPAEKVSLREQDQMVPEMVPGKGETILLVDDEEYVIEMEEQILESLGYRVTSRVSSIEALEAFRANSGKFDLVITDMAMPKLPGDKFAAELLKIRPDIPILLYTGYSETMSEEKAASYGIKGFLYKPVGIQDLSLKIRQILDKG
ncbi:cache domain-containing protein [Desulfospira joergensenii]|uniref:cache domain-containing protein n=1 Tax=Desulfospira joergensenii TaxID=53329 RepID=UPI0003F98BD9|nr:cache domain-containing protein [Desulfospira joergensenii]